MSKIKDASEQNAPKPPEAPKLAACCAYCFHAEAEHVPGGCRMCLDLTFPRCTGFAVQADAPMVKPAPAPEPKQMCSSSRCDGVQHWLGDQSFACPNVCTCADKPGLHTHDPEPKQGSDSGFDFLLSLGKRGSEEPDYEAALTEVFNRASIKGEEHLMVPKAAYLALRAELSAIKAQAEDATEYVLAVENRELRKEIEGLRIRVGEYEDMTEINKRFSEIEAELASAREERDKFEAESEQKGADLMAAEGVIAEIIDAYERSASSELGQLIEDARAARAKEGEMK